MPRMKRELLRDFGLADAGRAAEQERADRLVRPAEARARHLDRRRERVDRRILAEHDALQVAVERLAACERSSLDTLAGGMRAILATISSTSVRVIVFFCLFFGRMRCAAPASSITSIALSGR